MQIIKNKETKQTLVQVAKTQKKETILMMINYYHDDLLSRCLHEKLIWLSTLK